MKFSVRQIIASASGAVIAAVIASLFGVKGTIIGVAIGSAAATFGTAVVAQSIERGQNAVKQVAVRVPDRTALLRRIGATATTGEAETTEPESSAPTELVAPMTAQVDDPTEVQTAAIGDDPTIAMAAVPGVTAPATEALPATAAAAAAAAGAAPAAPERTPRGIPWRAITATALVVFVLSLGAVTAVELIAGHPLTDLFSHSTSNDPSVVGLFNQTPPATTSTTTSTSTTTTSTSSTTTTTTSPTSTTSTTGSGVTTTTTPGQGGTTTTSSPGLNLFGTTTTAPGG